MERCELLKAFVQRRWHSCRWRLAFVSTTCEGLAGETHTTEVLLQQARQITPENRFSRRNGSSAKAHRKGFTELTDCSCWLPGPARSCSPQGEHSPNPGTPLMSRSSMTLVGSWCHPPLFLLLYSTKQKKCFYCTILFFFVEQLL